MEEQQVFKLSSSVMEALSRFRSGQAISSWDITQEILQAHGEYGQYLGGRVRDRKGWEGAELRSPDEWMQALYNLLDPGKTPEIHGRLAILGLAEIDPELKKYLITLGFYEPLRNELTEVKNGQRFEELLRQPEANYAGQTEQAAAQQTAGVQTAAQQPAQGTAVQEQPGESLPAASKAYSHALALALEIASQASSPRPADSVVLLAALLAGTSFTSLTAALERQAGKVDPAGSPTPPEPPAAVLAMMINQLSPPNDTSDLAGLPAEVLAPRFLNMKEDYGLERIADREVDPALPLTRPLGAELEGIDRAAQSFAAQANPGGEAEPDHLLAALLAPRLVQPTPSVQRRLLNLGYDLEGLRRAVLEAVRAARTGERIAVWERALLARDYLPPIAGYISDYVRDDAPDRLNIEDEVANIAAVLTYKEVSPPLSLGLFGDWGSGKTFFMTKLKQAIETSTAYYLDHEKKTGQPAQMCSRVVQIVFNAWNYSDTNLWAGLVTRIYEALYNEFNDRDEKDKQYKQQIEQQVAEAKGAVRQAQAQKELAGERVKQAHAALIDAQKTRQEKENSLRGLVSDLARLFNYRQNELEPLKHAANALGYPEAAQTFESLQALNEDLKSFSSRSSALLFNSFRSHWTLLILAACVLGLPLLVTLAVERFLPSLQEIGQRVMEVAALVTGLLAALKFQIDRGMGWVKQIEQSFQEAQQIRQERLKAEGANDPVKQARDELVLAESQEQAAATNLQAAQLDLQRLQSELAELRPERRFFHLIEERSQSAAYRQYLGIISLIRTDFEQISRLMVDMADEGDKRDLANEAPPIQRIILYIDDLDRCRPERVVEVLEAVHLLLAFPLFVVVVGVDPRWLHQSLLKHYSSTLDKGEPQVVDGRVLPGYATPQDYLEKIFQIPYALKPVQQSGYESLVKDLLGASVQAGGGRRDGARTTPPPSAALSGDGQAAAAGERQPDRPTGTGGETAAPAEGSSEPAPTLNVVHRRTPDITHFTPLNTNQLEFTEAEQREILRLWPLFRTPRTIKRYVNLYRLLRAGLRSQRDVTLFEGSPARPGEYRVAMLLLAVVTSFPNQAARFLAELDKWMEASQARDTGEPLRWLDFVKAQQAKRVQVPGKPGSQVAGQDPKVMPGEIQAPSIIPASVQNPNVNPGQADDTITDEVQGEMSWERLLDGLEQVGRAATFDPANAESLHKWAVLVSRYSFSIG